jgi:YD repeat-containing protein
MGGMIYPNPLQLIRVEFSDGALLERQFESGGEREVLVYSGNPNIPSTARITLTVVRNANNQVIEVRSSGRPTENANDIRPVVKYEYYPTGNPFSGNLRKVMRLARAADSTDSAYDVTEYSYKTLIPHLIEKVVGPLGLVTFRASWNNQGQLLTTTDAAGLERSVAYGSGGTDTDGTKYADTTVTKLPYGNKLPGVFTSLAAADRPVLVTTTKSDGLGNVVKTETSYEGTLDAGWSTAAPISKNTFDGAKLKSSVDALTRTTQFFYDPEGRLEKTVKPGGFSERISYNELGQPKAVTDGRDKSTFSFYQDGRLVATEDAKRQRTTTAYIETGEFKGKVDYVEDALGNRTYARYYSATNPDGNPAGSVSETFLLEKPNSGDYAPDTQSLRRNWTKSTYYPNGLLKSTTATRTGRNANDADAVFTVETKYEYDAQGRVTKTTQTPSNNPFTVSVDESANPQLHATTQIYNKLGKVYQSTDKYGRTTTYYYDRRGNLVQTVFPWNQPSDATRTVTRTVYDVNNRPIYQQVAHLVAAAGLFAASTTNGTHFIYDGFGRVVKTEKLDAIGIEFVQAQTDTVPAVNVPDVYDAKLVSGVTPLVLESTTTDYDLIGRVTKVKDALGRYRRFEYQDAATSPGPPTPPLKRTFVGDGSGETKVTEEEYDANGNVVLSRTFDAGTVKSVNSFDYDELNRQTVQRVHTLTGQMPTGVYSEIKTIYDALGRRTRTTDADGHVTDFAYDGPGRLTKVTQWPGGQPVVTQYSYDEVGNLIVQKDALGRETKYEYDNFGRRIKRTLPGTSGGQTLKEIFAYDVVALDQLLDTGSKLVQRDYRIDFNNGNVTPQTSAQAIRREYDVRGRLTWKGSKEGSGNAAATVLVAYTYTPWGARATMTDPSGTTTYVYGRVDAYASNPTAQQFFNGSDRLVVKQRVNNWVSSPSTPPSTDAVMYEYDLAGNLKRQNTKYTFTIDAAGKVTDVSTPSPARTDVRYEYDGQNRLNRVRQGSDNDELANYAYSSAGLLKQTTYTVPTLSHTYVYNSANQLLNCVIDKSVTQIRKFNYNPLERTLSPSGQRRAAWEYADWSRRLHLRQGREPVEPPGARGAIGSEQAAAEFLAPERDFV